MTFELCKYIQIACANFNTFEQLLKELWPKTHYDKNHVNRKLCESIFKNFQPQIKKYVI